MPESERPFTEKLPAQETPQATERQVFEQPAIGRAERPTPKAQETPAMSAASLSGASAAARVSEKTEARQRIEHVMEEGLGEVYKTMPPAAQKKFKEEGEKAAAEIETLLYKVKVQTKKIFKLIFLWLRTIPGVNHYFLEQEAKLKTDEIIKIKEEMEKAKSEQRVW